ncbi:MAG: ATP-binding protein [Candidatus Levybacteria bacterium]|nr:ATP-binding protein [Candidatus Levybacteria bacterium]
MNKPILYILCGIPFSGKSTLAQKLAKQLGFVRVDLDEVKFEMFGDDIQEEEIDQAGWNKVYHEMYKRIRDNLQEGKVVLHDTGNFTKYERDLVRKEAEKVGVVSKVLFVKVPVETARERWVENKRTKKRFDISKEAFEEAVDEMEEPSVEKNVIGYNNNDSLDDLIRKIKST